MTERERDEGLRILHRISLHIKQSAGLHSDDVRTELIKAGTRLLNTRCEPLQFNVQVNVSEYISDVY